MEVRRLLEPMAAALAATRIFDAQLAEVKRHLDAMREARDEVAQLNSTPTTPSSIARSSRPRATRPSSPSARQPPCCT
jgi:DNA-binding FadR family transcriptional regulator